MVCLNNLNTLIKSLKILGLKPLCDTGLCARTVQNHSHFVLELKPIVNNGNLYISNFVPIFT